MVERLELLETLLSLRLPGHMTGKLVHLVLAGMPPTEVTFRLSPRFGIHAARDAHDWFLAMMREHEEFEVETDWAAELPVPFVSETVRDVLVV